MEILNNIWFNFALMAVAFGVLFKSADFFVESAAGMATHFNLPKMLVGIVVVGFATTAPEIAVSAQSAYMGHPEIAFGNAIGSVIVDDGVALALAGIVAPTAILVNKNLLKTSGLFLIGIDVLAFILAFDLTISRLEGVVFILLLFAYMGFLFYSEKKRKLHLVEVDEELMQKGQEKLGRLILLFALGLGGVILASRGVIHSSLVIAHHFSISETIIGLTVVAIGTSLPEISTCIVAARKGHGEIAVGDIIGADILNILWIIGVSAAITPMQLQPQTVYFSFAFMFLIVGTMLISLRLGYSFGKKKGFLLLAIYLVYLVFNYQMHFLPH
ncbi:MAG TPA: calcium/sodium antiporter [Sediminispirochaeta sp.]|nr:calcium/sodium antiporter [Sediminispirochaeta sp.]